MKNIFTVWKSSDEFPFIRGVKQRKIGMFGGKNMYHYGYGKYKYEMFGAYEMFGVTDENHFIEIPVKNILKESITTDPRYCDRQYIIFINPNDSKILVNTDYEMKGDKVSLRIPYTRKLCDTLEEYKHLSTEYIESAAYGSYMDGAR